MVKRTAPKVNHKPLADYSLGDIYKNADNFRKNSIYYLIYSIEVLVFLMCVRRR